MVKRRDCLGLAAAATLPPVNAAGTTVVANAFAPATSGAFAPAVQATPAMLALAQRFADGAALRVGRLAVTVEPLVDNGNSVPVHMTLDSPMTPDQHVVGMALFSEKNPEPHIADFVLSPASGLARVSTRVRLTGTGQLLGVAKLSDGTCWMQTVDVIVTLAACIED